MMFTQLSLGIFLLGIIIVPMVFAETYTVVNVEMSYIRGCEEITNGCFDPYLVTVRIGDTVIWENADSQGHNVASGDEGAGSDVGAIFDSDFIDPGESFSYTFDAVGTYDYFCMIHPWMKGTVIVETASGSKSSSRCRSKSSSRCRSKSSSRCS
jgi:plastocyanin